MKFSVSIRRILIGMCALIFLAVSMVGHFFIQSTKQDLELQTRQYLREVASQNAGEIRAAVEMQLDQIESLAYVIASQERFDVDEMMQLLQAEAESTTFKRLAFIPSDGFALTTDGVRFSVLDRPYYAKALAGESNVSETMTDKAGGGKINVYAVPFVHRGEQKGVIIATSATDVFAELMREDIFGGAGFSFLLEPDGTVIAFSAQSAEAVRFDNLFDEFERSQVDAQEIETLRKTLQEGQDGLIDYLRNNVSRVGAYTKVGINDWYLFTVVPRTVISESSDRLLTRTVLSVVSVGLLFGLLLFGFIAQIHRSNRKLTRLAFSDPLTGGSNLNRFKDLAEQCMAKGREQLYLLRVDVDNFKLFNDMYGYEEGNRILLDIDGLLSKIIGTEGIHGRIGSDNFLCLVQVDSDRALMEYDAQFRKDFGKILQERGKHYTVTFTVGIYPVFTDPFEMDIDKMIDRAAMAHRRAKLQESEYKLAFYTDELRDTAIRIKHIEDHMHKALQTGEFLVYLQPKYHLESGRMEGAEALVRWKWEGSLLPPSAFIPVFERNGFIVNLDLFVAEEVCRMQRQWLDLGLPALPISVNQSKPLVYMEHYVETLNAMVRRYDLSPQLIELELLESLLHENIKKLQTVVTRLRGFGFLICIDDFGSGYSSLNMLKDIHADVLKIDRGFLSSAENDARAEMVLHSIIQLGKNLQMSVVTEGVETEQQAKLLRGFACDTAQGFLYARPMPIAAYEEKLRAEQVALSQA